MTLEEARDILRITLDWDKGKLPLFPIPMEQYITAQEMAIEALQREINACNEVVEAELHIRPSEKDGKLQKEQAHVLKRMSKDQVTYDVDYLLKNLSREVFLLMSYKNWRDKQKENEE